MNIIAEQVCLLVALFSATWGLFASRNQKSSLIARTLAIVSSCIWIFLRGVLLNHAPFSNMYESLSFFGLLYLLKCFLGKRITAWGLYLPALIMLGISVALPWSYKVPGIVPAALQSFWIFIHVPSYFIGYVSITMAAGYAALLLFQKKKSKDPNSINRFLQRELKVAWFFCSVGLITGAIWADISWGRFWFWDPKETWALITWVLIAAALHTKRWPRLKYSIVLLAFLAMLYTYFGVAFFASGLHSYTG